MLFTDVGKHRIGELSASVHLSCNVGSLWARVYNHPAGKPQSIPVGIRSDGTFSRRLEVAAPPLPRQLPSLFRLDGRLRGKLATGTLSVDMNDPIPPSPGHPSEVICHSGTVHWTARWHSYPPSSG